jgi:hypothetical protein
MGADQRVEHALFGRKLGAGLHVLALALAGLRDRDLDQTPVGPIIRIFFGSTSSRRPPESCRRRQRLRSAIETARLASAWPTMKRSSSETISRGEKSVMGL